MRQRNALESSLREAEKLLNETDTNDRKYKNRQSRVDSLEAQLNEWELTGSQTEKEESAAASFSKQQKAIESLSPSPVQAEFQRKETPWWKFFSNPVELTAATTAESLPQMLPTMAAGLINPPAMVVTAGATSHGAESSGRVINAMAEQGVDLKNPIAVLEWFKNRAQSEPAIAKADLAALGPATFDALSAGIAGRWLHGAIGSGAKPIAVATGKEMGAQMAGGAAGSITASLLAGEPIDWKDVVLEMAGEIAPGEAMMNVLGEVRADTREHADFQRVIEANAKRLVDRGEIPAQVRQVSRLSKYAGQPLEKPIEPKPTRIVSPVEFTDSVNSENLLNIANSVRDRFEQLSLQGRNTDQTDAMLSLLRPLLDKAQPNRIENLSRFFGLKVDEAVTDMPERYRTVVVPGLSRPEQPSTKAPAPKAAGMNQTGGEPLEQPIVGENLTGQPAAPVAPVATKPVEPLKPVVGEPVVLNGRAFSKRGDVWFDATSGKERKVQKPGVVAQLESIQASQAAAAAHPSTYDVTTDALQTDENAPVVTTTALRNTRVIDPATGHPVQDTDVDPKTLKLSDEVPNFKEGAGDTVEVSGTELTGKYTRIGTGRTVVWERLNGDREVITGRHRWQLALRTGVKDFSVQILREADGFTKEMARVLDAESNIRDNQGAVKDYAHYFRNTPYDEKTAIEKGLLRAGPDAKGRDGFNIGKYASDSLYALYMAGKIPERQASAIAKVAPNNEDLQRIGINAAQDGANIQETVARMEAAQATATASGKASQFDFFADTSMEETWKKQGAYVAEQRKRLQDIISTRKSVINKPDAATSTGSIKTKLVQAQAELESAAADLTRWEKWASDPELRTKVEAAGRGETVENKNGITKAKERPNNAAPPTELISDDAKKTPEQLVAEKEEADKKEAIAKLQNKKLTGSVDTTMVLPGTEEAAGEGDIPLLTQAPNKRAALATAPPPELATNPPLNAQGITELRSMVNSAASLLPKRVRDVISAMLDTPAMRKLDWSKLKVTLTDRIEGGYSGLATVESDLVELARNADPDTFPHEVFHFLYEMLPQKYKAAVEAIRLEAINKALERTDLTDSERALLESIRGTPMESMAFSRDAARPEFYQLVNPSEFLAGMAGRKFATDHWNARNASFMENFKNRLVAWKNGIVDAFKRVIGSQPGMDQIYRELLAGKHVNRMTATIEKAFTRYGSLSMNAKEANNAEKLAATQEARDIEATHQLGQSADIVDLLEKHGAGTATPSASRLLGYFDYAGIREVGRRLNNGLVENYSQIKARVTDPYKMGSLARIAMKQNERFDVAMQDIQKRFTARAQELTNPSFLRLAVRESVANANVDAQGVALRNATAILNSALEKTQRVLKEERAKDRGLAELEGQLREVSEASKSSTAMQQLITDMVKVLSTTTDGLEMLSNSDVGNRTQMLKLYRELKRATGQPLHSESLLRWGTYILSKNADLRDALLGAQFNATSEIRTAMNAYEHKLLADLEGDPAKTVKALLRERTKLVTDKDKAAFAWKQLHKELMDRLADFHSLEEANTVATAILADPDYKSLRKEIAKDSGTKGANLAGEAPKLANGHSAGTIYLPDLSEFDIDPKELVGSKTRFQAVRQRYEHAKSIYEPWLANPANMDDPNYALHQRNFEEISSYYLALGIMQPSDKNFVFKRSFNILQQAVRAAGGRVAAGAKKALGQLQFEQHQAAAWTQRYTNLLSTAIQKALDSHADDLGEGGIHDRNTEYYRRHGNQLRASFNQQSGGLAVGDRTGSGWVVTPEDMALLKLESEAVTKAFEILGNTQLTVDTLGGVTILRHAIKGHPLMTTRGYTKDADIKSFLEQFVEAKKAHDAAPPAQKPQHEAEMLRLLDAWWGRIGHSFLWDRSADFAHATPFDGPGAAFQVLADQMENRPGSIPNTTSLFQQLASLSTMTPDEAKAIVLDEFGRIIEDVHREVVSDDVAQSGLRSEESKNSFTRSRNETVGPYVFYDNGFRNTNSAESFGQNIVSRSFDRVVTALQATEADIDRQIQEFKTQVEQLVAQGATPSKARNQVQTRNAMERRNGETYDNYKKLLWTKKVIHDVTVLLQKHTDLSDDLTFNRYVGALQGMLIGTIATFRNVGRAPIKLGQMAMRLGSNPITAMSMAGYYGYVDTGARMLGSLTLSLLKTAYLLPKGIALTARERTQFGKWWGKAMRPVVEELGHTMYMRLKDVQEAVRRGELHIPDYLAQWDATMAGLAMTQGRILSDEQSKGTYAAQKTSALIEKYVLSLQKMLMPMFGDTWANLAVNSVMDSRVGVFRMWETQLRRIQKEFSGKVRFNFNNLQDPANRISPKEFFNKRPWVADRAMLNIRNAFADVGLDFDEKAVQFIGELEKGNTNAEFLTEAERSKLKSSQIDYANRASIANQPLHLQRRDPVVTFFKPFMQWPTRMLSHLVDELAVPSQLPKAAKSNLDVLKMRSVQVGIAMATLGLVAILSSITAAGDEEGNRKLKKLLFNQITGFKQPWERDNPIKGWVPYSMASVPLLEAVATLALSDMSSRASLDPSLVVLEKTKDIVRYIGGVAQTGDPMYRLPELIGGLFPDAKIVLNRIESQEGKRELNNVVALARRHGDTELLRPPMAGSSGGIQANQLSPYADRMVAAAMRNDQGEVRRLYDEAVLVARDMGKRDPEGAVRAMYEGRNPYTRVFRAQLSPGQREEFLLRLSPSERQEVQSAETAYASGAQTIGANANFERSPSRSAGTAQSPSSQPQPPAPAAGASVRSPVASGRASSRPVSRLSAFSGGSIRSRRPVGRRPRLARGAIGGRVAGFKRLRGPRLSRFA